MLIDVGNAGAVVGWIRVHAYENTESGGAFDQRGTQLAQASVDYA